MLKLLIAACGLSHVVVYSAVPLFWVWVACVLLAAGLVAYLLNTQYGRHGRDKRDKQGKRAITLRRHTLVPSWLKKTLLYALIFSAASAVGAWQLNSLLTNLLPHALDKQPIAASFVITRMGTKSPRYQQFEVMFTSGNTTQTNTPQNTTHQNNKALANNFTLAGKKARLSWYKKTNQPLPFLSVGQHWQAELTLRRPRGLANPSGFDYAAWLIAQGYSATGYLSGTANIQQHANQPVSLLAQLRAHVDNQLNNHPNAPASDAKRFFKALLIGMRDELTVDDWHILQATGTVHLMAISGLHVGLVAAIGFWLGLMLHRIALRVFARYSLSFNSVWGYRILPVFMAISLAASYALLAGFAVPTRRALVAVVLVNIAWCLGVRFAPSHFLALALFLVALSEPFAWLQAGFWLSFGAVALLIVNFSGYGYCQGLANNELSPNLQKFARWRQRLGMGVAMQWLLSLAMCLPLWLLGFPASALSPIANMLAVPLVSLFFVPGLLLWLPLSFTPLGDPFLQLLSAVFEGFWWLLMQLAQSPVSLLWPSLPMQGAAAIVVLVLLMFACVFMLLPRSYAMPVGSLALVALLGFGGSHTHKHFELTVLDVGQGLAIVTNHAGEASQAKAALNFMAPKNSSPPTLVFDTGAAFGERFNAGAHIIAPFLRRTGVEALAIMLSHGDADHKGGLAPLIKQFAPAQLWSGEQFSGLPSTAKPCHAGQQWQWGGAHYQVLWPQRPSPLLLNTVKPASGNNRSCVLLISYAGIVFLLPGDIDKTVERALVNQGVLPKVDVLIAPHHGSKTSSSQAFLEAVQPQHIVISAGFKNRYGHPHAQVLKRYQGVGAKVWNTASHGAVRFRVNLKGQINIRAERLANPKLWY